MGMMPAYFTTTSTKKRKKPQYRNAAAAKQAKKNEESWKKLLDKYSYIDDKPTHKLTINVPRTPTRYVRSHDDIPSLKPTWAPCTKAAQKKSYTGSKIIGIGTLHKSNAVPIFDDAEAKDISRMRR
jgi:molecular chaperone DnaK (HSP70)